MHLIDALRGRPFVAASAIGLLSLSASAAPSFVDHTPAQQVFNQPAGVTMREPDVPREDEPVDLWIKIGPSFSYNAVAVYYTTDGSAPQGSQGVGQVGTQVLLSFGPSAQITFQFNEPGQSGNDDWWKAQMPLFTREYGTQVRYKVSAWDTGAPVPEVFAGGGAVYEYTNKLAWPGAGSGNPNPGIGFPSVHFWKEAPVAGNNYINVMVDENGSLFDVYYPSAGCVQGMGTKNEGYVDGPDTFPPLLPPDARGQMNINQMMPGLRVGGTTYWFSNQNGTDYANHEQEYIPDTNVVETTMDLVAGGHNISIQQFDYAPKDIAYPLDDGGNPNRGMFIKRMILTNNGGTDVESNLYFYADFALNGGDGFDGMFTDPGRGAMIGYDNTQRLVSSSGEYNPTTFSDYEKAVSVYLAAAMRLSDTVGGSTSAPATDFWSDTSSDQGMGWIGMKVDLPAGEPVEIAVLVVGGFDNFPNAIATYDFQMDNAIDWFHSADLDALQDATEDYWSNWLNEGVLIDFPDDRFDETHRRGLLATALHLDGKNGGIIAGMHNGAYPFVWPRDAAWAGITLARTGHVDEAREIVRFLTDIAYRDAEPWGDGFWKQKYSTDGFTIWGTPQVDETSCFPWLLRYIFDVEGDINLLDDNYVEVFEAGRAMSENSTIDNRLRFEAPVNLMYSMNLWEDSFDTFIYSNASIVRGLDDASAIADLLDQNVCPGGPGTCNYHNDKALFDSRSATILNGTIARYQWNCENTDISQLGATYPFYILPPTDPVMVESIDRMNGVATDCFGNNHPLVNFAGEWQDLIDRYWGDTYWNGGPWFLTTLWYGAYYAERQDYTPGTDDIDNHRYRVELLLDRLGPGGLGAEQIAPSSSLLYPGQTDYVLQAAYPNAWESMSFLVDAMMLFLDYTPDAWNNTLRIEPKLPSAWETMLFSNVPVGTNRIDVEVTRAPGGPMHVLTNVTGNAVLYDTVLRVPGGTPICDVTENGVSVAFSYDLGTGRVFVDGSLAVGAGASTTIKVHTSPDGDANFDGSVDINDLNLVIGNFGSNVPLNTQGDVTGDGMVDINDLNKVLGNFGETCV